MEDKNRILNGITRKRIAWTAYHLGILVILLRIDGPLYRGFHTTIEWIGDHHIFLLQEFAKNRLWEFFNQFGTIWAAITISVFIWIYDPPRRKYLLTLAAAIILSYVIYVLLQHCVGKLRPRVTGGIVTYLPFPQGWHQNENLSFSSGHANFASTLCVFLALLYPKAEWLFFIIVAACGIARVYLTAHYFADVYAGALIGYAPRC